MRIGPRLVSGILYWYRRESPLRSQRYRGACGFLLVIACAIVTVVITPPVQGGGFLRSVEGSGVVEGERRDRVLDVEETLRVVASGEEGRVLIAWASRYCQGEKATFALDSGQRDQLAGELGFAAGACGRDAISGDCLYFADHWGGLGVPERTRYAETGSNRYYLIDGVPYACLWIARGRLLPVDPVDGRIVDSGSAYALFWRQSDCVTAGLPDVRRVTSKGLNVYCE